jgi:hypothetical protein
LWVYGQVGLALGRLDRRPEIWIFIDRDGAREAGQGAVVVVQLGLPVDIRKVVESVVQALLLRVVSAIPSF